MVTRLVKHGRDLALVIEPSILTKLQIDENTALELAISGRALIVTPVDDPLRREKLEAALADGNERFARTFKKLAE
jgi:antitoxin component of MazEF toxin-antitoxin module